MNKVPYSILAMEMERLYQSTMGKIIEEKRDATADEIHQYCVVSEALIEASGWDLDEYTERMLSEIDHGWD